MVYKITFFDDSIQIVKSLHRAFKLLKNSGNISILDRNNPDHIDEIMRLAEEYDVCPAPRFYIVTSIGNDYFNFTDDIEDWIENDMRDCFWNEYERPYIEAYMSYKKNSSDLIL